MRKGGLGEREMDDRRRGGQDRIRSGLIQEKIVECAVRRAEDGRTGF